MTTRFVVEQVYDVSVEECVAFMSDPGLHRHVAGLEGITHRRIVNYRQDGHIRAWDVDIGVAEQLPSFARSLLRSDQLRWVQHFEMDMEKLEFRFRVEHGFPSRLLDVHGIGRLHARGPDRSALVIEGDVTSGVPLIGGRLEALVAQRSNEMLELDGRRRREYMEANRGNARPLQLNDQGEPDDPRLPPGAPPE